MQKALTSCQPAGAEAVGRLCGSFPETVLPSLFALAVHLPFFVVSDPVADAAVRYLNNLFVRCRQVDGLPNSSVQNLWYCAEAQVQAHKVAKFPWQSLCLLYLQPLIELLSQLIKPWCAACG